MTKRKDIFLIVICWMTYTLAQLGRYSYGANITLIMERFAVGHAYASLPATLFFFAYGVGQILVGFFCHKFNRRLLVAFALAVSGAVNLSIFFGAPFISIKYLWLLNGFAQANLWPAMVFIVKENISAERIEKAGVILATASTGGRFAAIGVCAVFAIDVEKFMYCFLSAGILLLIMATTFLFATGKLKKPEPEKVRAKGRKDSELKPDKKAVILLLLFGEFSLACYAISGGLQSWVPVILKDSYGLSDAFSIFMSVMLPLFTLTSAVITPFLHRKLKNYVLISFLSFVFGAAMITGVMLFLGVHWLLVTVMFTAEAVTMGIIANATTVNVPLTFNGKFNAGFLAGFLNGACYVGAAIATYVLGNIADESGWNGAFILLIAIAAVSALFAAAYLIIQRKSKREYMEYDYDKLD